MVCQHDNPSITFWGENKAVTWERDYHCQLQTETAAGDKGNWNKQSSLELVNRATQTKSQNVNCFNSSFNWNIEQHQIFSQKQPISSIAIIQRDSWQYLNDRVEVEFNFTVQSIVWMLFVVVNSNFVPYIFYGISASCSMRTWFPNNTIAANRS